MPGAIVKHSSTGKKLIEAGVDLTTGIKTLGIKNSSLSTVCIRIQAYEPKMYEFSPKRSLIPAGSSMDVEIKELRKGTLASVSGGGLNFHLVAMAWPNSSKKFDPELWKMMEAKKVAKQIISFGDAPEYSFVEDTPPHKINSRDVESGGGMGSGQSQKIIDVVPAQLSFKRPSSSAQTVTASIKNTASFPVAVKIQTNKRQLYSVKPGKGVIPVNRQMQISFEARVTEKDLHSDKEKHVMCFCAVPWPSQSQQFDNAEFGRLEKDKTKVQKILMPVDFSGKTDTKRENDERQVSKEDRIKYVDTEPLNLTFGHPYIGEISAIKIRNKECTAVAFKMHTNKRLLYSVHPNRGVIKANDAAIVKIQILKTITKEDLLDNIEDDPHQFQLTALPWPRRLGEEFDPAQWTAQEASMKDRLQKESLSVTLKRKVTTEVPLKTMVHMDRKSKSSKKDKVHHKPDGDDVKEQKEKEGFKQDKGENEDTGKEDKEDLKKATVPKRGKKKKSSKKKKKSLPKEKGKKRCKENVAAPLVAVHPTTVIYHIPPDDKDKDSTVAIINISKAVVAYKIQGDQLLKKQFTEETQKSMQGVLNAGDGAQINMTLRVKATKFIEETVESQLTLKAMAWTAGSFDEQIWAEKSEKDADSHCQTVPIHIKLVKVDRQQIKEEESESGEEENEKSDQGADVTPTPSEYAAKLRMAESQYEAEEQENTASGTSTSEEMTETENDDKQKAVSVPSETARQPSRVFGVETEGPYLVWLSPATSPSSANACSVNLVNTSEEGVAFKFVDDAHIIAEPTSGLLPPGGTCEVALHINNHACTSAYKAGYRVRMMAINLPADVKELGPGSWDKHDHKQTVLFNAPFA